MYDATALAQGAAVAAAEPAAIASYADTAKMVNAILRDGGDIPDAVGRQVKQAGADTTLKNAARDGAEWAWVAKGDTCAFCIMLASNGWQRASKRVLKGNHAEHIHNNCDCEFAVRFDGESGVAGYDPDRFKAMYDSADGKTWEEKVNAMRREQYAANKDEINAQKRAAYARRKGLPEDAADAIINKGEEDLLQLSSHNMHNSSDPIYERIKYIPPEKGYDDVFVHGDPWGVSTKNADGVEFAIPNDEFIKTLKSLDLENEAIRLCACSAGAEDRGLAYLVAREMDMPVIASTTDIWIGMPDKHGVSKMELYADNGAHFPDYSKPGRWRIFNTDGSITEV